MKRKGILIAAVFLVAAFALTGVASAAGEKIDLFLIVDGSNSITPANYTLQLTGYADAIADPKIVPQNGNISVCVIMFGYWPPKYTDLEIPYTTINNQADADAIAKKILAMPQPRDHTPMADAFTLANNTLTGYVAGGITSPEVRQIIDIATDGRPNKVRGVPGRPYQEAVNATYEARDDAILKGHFDEVNVLGVDVSETDIDQPPAHPYNRDFLVRLNYSLKPANHSGFYMEATVWEEFPDAIKEKMYRELWPVSDITKNVSKAICNCGDELSYTITYSNADNVDLTKVVLRDPIPPTTTLVPNSISNGGTVDGGEIIWDIGTLKIGESQTQSFNVTVHNNLVNGTVIINTATLYTNETGPKSASASTLVLVPVHFNLSAYKAVDKSFASPNDTLNYLIHYKNVGTGTLTNTTIQDTIPANTTYILESMGLNGVSLTDAKDADAGTYYPGDNKLIWDIGTLVPGASGDATFKVKIKASVAGGTIIRNTAILTTNETEPVKPSVITKIRAPAPLPVIMPVGIAVLIGLLSLVAIRGIFGRRR